MKKFYKLAPAKKLLLLLVTSGLFFAGMHQVFASISSYSASDFSQYCAQNSTTCSKNENPAPRSDSVSCPSETQVIQTVYVHAGNGQTVFELPDSGYSETFSNSNATVTVSVVGTGKDHPDLSWIAVVCGDNNPTNTPTPTPTPTPTNTPTPTPTGTVIICDVIGDATCEVDIGPTATPTATLTPTATPTPTSTSGGSSSQSSGSSSSQGATAQVLAETSSPTNATTLANTGSFADTLMSYILYVGLALIGASYIVYAQAKNKIHKI